MYQILSFMLPEHISNIWVFLRFKKKTNQTSFPPSPITDHKDYRLIS